MSTIDNLDFTNYQRFATDTESYEDFRASLNIDSAGLVETNYISKQVEVIGQKPVVPSLTQLFETDHKKTWALFELPPSFHQQRAVNGYTVSKLGPPAAQESDIRKVESQLHEISELIRTLKLKKKKGSSPEVEKEIAYLLRLKKQGLRLLRTLYKGILNSHEMVDFVQGRVLQYLQG